MRNVVKVRLYPSSEQQLSLAKAFGSCRYIWNFCLAENNRIYKETGKGISAITMKKWIPQLKKNEKTKWLKETYSQCLQSSVINLGIAYKNFFEKRGGYPSFKSRYGKQSLQYPQNVKVIDSGLNFPKIGEIKANIHRSFDGELKTVTVSKTKTNKYYASLLFDNGLPEPESNINGKVLGIDLGISSYCITSDGSKYDNPHHFKKHEHNLKRKQQKLSRKQKGSNSRNKATRLVARAHEKISNARQDFLHKLSRKLVDKNQVIVCENLNIKGMVRNHKLAKAISNCGWGMFLNFLKCKCKQEGKVFLQIDRFFPSSKTCNNCLNVVGSLSLDIRTWDCPSCNTLDIDRDVNAAKNCRDEGIRILSCGTRDTAKGGNVRQRRGRKSTVVAVADDFGSPHRNL
ncbi:RNA-guided endonuclease InsQ/TnpB family protein [Pleurocapsa sp. FMAR1]|uniref:RNA-guided endonuclease InsQ/TnpB family protein n=1 Tax=Pleurocapsa sp. FMAR1 TaxID=3040204 RepID=UPI0029C68170|nr:RNA-guided endonuclease TnpB family protein [Pleurocapsa sp. FMAR1]